MKLMNETELADLYAKYTSYLHKFQDPNLDLLIEELGQRLVSATYSTKIDDGYCGPGGIIKFALDSFSIANKFAKSIENETPPPVISKKSLALITLLFPLGRLGDLENEQFVDQTSDWHRNKLGQLYEYNEKCPKMSVPHRTLFLLQHYGVKISAEEMIGIICSTGMHFEENKFYLHNISELVQLCTHAIDIAYEREKSVTRQGKNS